MRMESKTGLKGERERLVREERTYDRYFRERDDSATESRFPPMSASTWSSSVGGCTAIIMVAVWGGIVSASTCNVRCPVIAPKKVNDGVSLRVRGKAWIGGPLDVGAQGVGFPSEVRLSTESSETRDVTESEGDRRTSIASSPGDEAHSDGSVTDSTDGVVGAERMGTSSRSGEGGGVGYASVGSTKPGLAGTETSFFDFTSTSVW